MKKFYTFMFLFCSLAALGGIFLAYIYISMITEPQEKIKIIANLGMMITAVSVAMAIFIGTKLNL